MFGRELACLNSVLKLAFELKDEQFCRLGSGDPGPTGKVVGKRHPRGCSSEADPPNQWGSP